MQGLDVARGLAITTTLPFTLVEVCQDTMTVTWNAPRARGDAFFNIGSRDFPRDRFKGSRLPAPALRQTAMLPTRAVYHNWSVKLAGAQRRRKSHSEVRRSAVARTFLTPTWLI
jgi:hypothetical protein